jgi:hypothetical protein
VKMWRPVARKGTVVGPVKALAEDMSFASVVPERCRCFGKNAGFFRNSGPPGLRVTHFRRCFSGGTSAVGALRVTIWQPAGAGQWWLVTVVGTLQQPIQICQKGGREGLEVGSGPCHDAICSGHWHAELVCVLLMWLGGALLISCLLPY